MSEEKIEEVIVVTTKDKPIKETEGVRVVDVESDEGQKLAGKETVEALPRAYAVMRTIQRCEILKEEGKVVAKCGDQTLDLTQVKPEDIAETVEKKSIKECPECPEAIAVGWAINYIKPLNSLIATKVFNDAIDEKITPDEAMDKCITVAQDHGKTDLVDTLKHLKEMMHKPLSELEKEVEG